MPEQDEVTGATDTSEEVTAPAGEPEGSESERQNSAARLKEIETQLRELQEARVREEARAKAAEERAADAERLAAEKDRQYKGLQREITPKMQELNTLKQQLNNQSITASKLERMEKLVGMLAEQSLPPEQVEKLNQQIQAEQQRRELEMYKQQAQAIQQARPKPGLQILSPQQKADLKNAYFKEFANVDPLELTNEEWAAGIYDSAVEWENAVRLVFQRRDAAKQAQAQQTPEAIAAKLRKELEEQFKAELSKDKEALAETQQTIKQLQEELSEARRLAEEASKRGRGMDRSGSAPAEAAPRSKANKSLSQIPEEWLYGTPEQRAAYRKAMDDKSLRDQIIRGLS